MQEPEHAALARAQARVGSTLRGKYLLTELLGVGGMAAVYAATHRNTKRVAVKVLHAPLSVHPDLRIRFVREGYVANSVGHPGAVAVIDDDVAEDGAAFLVMELLEGETLEELRRRLGPRLPCRLVLDIAEKILDVLVAAHARPIIHRDIKPANLFLSCDRQIKILDFGVARMRDLSSGDPTTGALLLGTPAFMAPEQALGSPDVDGRTDLWALGATLFFLLTGKHVHGGASGPEILIWAATRVAPSLGASRPDLPPPLVALVDRALAFAKEDRWASAEAMRDALRALPPEVRERGSSGENLASIAVQRRPSAPPTARGTSGRPSEIHDLPTLSSSDAAAMVSQGRRHDAQALREPGAPGGPRSSGWIGSLARRPLERGLALTLAVLLGIVAVGALASRPAATAPPATAALLPPAPVVTLPASILATSSALTKPAVLDDARAASSGATVAPPASAPPPPRVSGRHVSPRSSGTARLPSVPAAEAARGPSPPSSAAPDVGANGAPILE